MIKKAMIGLHETIINMIKDDERNLSINELTQIAEKRFFNAFKCSDQEKATIKKRLHDEIFGFGPLEELMKNSEVNEIMANGYDKIYYEINGEITKSNLKFLSKDTFSNLIERLISLNGERIDESLPYVDTRLNDGSRLNIIIPPAALTGPHLTIRKFNNKKYSIKGLIDTGFIQEKIVTFLKLLITKEKNIIISGNTGSGKTTLLNALSEYIPDSHRIITIEDTAELDLKKNHLVTLQSRRENVEGKGRISIRQLLKNALRMRPDRIIIGECRGDETLDMLLAMNTGHMGSLSTIHANSAKEALKRIESIILLSNNLNPSGIREQISCAVDYVIHTKRDGTGQRYIAEIIEVTGMESDNITTSLIHNNILFTPELCLKLNP
jgi:pilus assembly protein CpaF